MTHRTAVITGAGQGMGRAIALKFAETDIRPILVGRTEAKLLSVADEVAAHGITAGVHILDVTDDEAIAAFGAELAETTVDVLVNCAGDWLIETLQDTSNEQLDQILQTNLRAPYILSRTLLPNLRRSDNASIINIGSIVTSMSVPSVSAYTAAKVGLKGLTGALAAELRPEMIRVVMICPDPRIHRCATPLRQASTSRFWSRPIPSRRWYMRWSHCRGVSQPVILRFFRCFGDNHQSLRRGSRMSRKPSPSRLIESTVIMIASPG